VVVTAAGINPGSLTCLRGQSLPMAPRTAPVAYGIYRFDVPGVHPGAPDDSGFGATIAARAVAGPQIPVRLHFVLADRERVFTTGVLAIMTVRE
jgi:hypothetical protein